MGTFEVPLRELRRKVSVSQCIVLELVPLRGENISSHSYKTGSCYLLGVLFKISEENPRPFILQFPKEPKVDRKAKFNFR